MWWGIIFGLGMISFVTFSYVAKLHKFKGTKLKTRMNYSLWVSIFFMLLFLWQSHGEIKVIVTSLLLGVVLSVPVYFSTKRWIEKRIEGTAIIYERDVYTRNLRRSYLWVIPLTILTLIYVHTGFGEYVQQIIDVIGLGLGFSYFIANVFILFYIVRVERKLGVPILENNLNKSILPFVCEYCSTPFDPPEGGLCIQCGRIICRNCFAESVKRGIKLTFKEQIVCSNCEQKRGV
jgi:hypothetical protein